MNKDVRLYNIIDKEDETRFILVREGCFFSINHDNIEQLKELFKRIEDDEHQLRLDTINIRKGEIK